MTEDIKKEKKLTLGGSKLTLGNALFGNKLIKPASPTGPVVIEVKRGKASSDVRLNAGQDSKHTENSLDDRRMAALQRSIDGLANSSAPTSTLSRLAEINQAPAAAIEVDTHATLEASEHVSLQDATEPQDRDSNDNDADLSLDAAKKLHISEASDKLLIDDSAANNKAKKAAAVKNDATNYKKADIKLASAPEIVEEEIPPTVKLKGTEQKKLKKADIFSMLNSEGDGKTRSFASIQRAKAKQMRKNAQNSGKVEKIYREVILPEVITVADLSNRMSERSADVVRELMKLGVMATSNQSIDADTAELVATTLGHSVKRYKESDVENILIESEDSAENLVARAPIVTIMGHVDHGKTSLLDALKSTNVVSDEAGGITQHIGAYSVNVADGRMITFIDTPGHEAFSAMRTRGAQVTDIVVLVVAADDGIKAQTIEAISHAKAANVPIIVAINKIDKPDADEQRVKQELLSYELVPEDFGGDIITVGVSAKQKLNLDKLEEAILLVADMACLTSNPNAPASGVVVEAKMDSARGVIATVIVQRGTLKKGDIIIAGMTYGRVKRICNDKGRTVEDAEPSCTVEVFGLSEVPYAGDKMNVVSSEKQARDIIDYRIRREKEMKVTASKTSLEELFLKASGESKIKELPIIIKADVQGSLEAITASLNKIHSDEVKIRILHSAVGGISDSDVSLAAASKAVILGFNVRSNASTSSNAEKDKVDIRYYSIIYNLIDDIKAIMSGMLSPIIREVYIGSVDIREVFNITKVGKVAGSYVTRGIIKRGAGVRLLRDNIVIHEGKLKTLKRFKDDVKEVREGYECGIAFENYDNIKVGDSVEVFEIVEEQQKL